MIRCWKWLVPVLLLVGCASGGDPRQPIPTRLDPAPLADRPAPLVVVLPGRYDDLGTLAASGIVSAIRQGWPDADVLLTGVGMAWYRDGVLVERLHREIIEPARHRGVGSIWLVGASIGGTGALLYERAHPGEVDGIVLLGPYLGERRAVEQILDAGGLAAWQPGPPRSLTATTFRRELWRSLKELLDDPQRAERLWLVYGEQDRYDYALPAIAPVLRPEQTVRLPGGHAWSVWTPAAAEVFERIAGPGRRVAAGLR